MAGLFWTQLSALIWKNWIVLAKHPIVNLLRCLVFPIAIAVLLAAAQNFNGSPDIYGIGRPTELFSVKSQFTGRMKLVWADNTNGTGSPSPTDIMNAVTGTFTTEQRSRVIKVDKPADIPVECPQNFRQASECYGAVVFEDVPGNATFDKPIKYKLRTDSGSNFIDVVNYEGNFQRRLMPLQWAIDQAIIGLKTGTNVPTPQQWPFTQVTPYQSKLGTRVSYVGFVAVFIVIAFSLPYIGIAYHLPGAMALERATGLTAHMKAMGLKDSARILSWYFSIAVVYLPAWIAMALIWHYKVWALTNAGLVLLIHVLFGLILTSWSFFVAAPFGKSPHLAAVVTTILSVICVILGTFLNRAGSLVSILLALFCPPSFYPFAIASISGFELSLFPGSVTRADPEFNLTLLPLIIVAIVDIFLYPLLAVWWESGLYGVKNPSKKKGSWKFWKKTSLANDTITLPEDAAISIRNLRKTFKTSFWRRKQVVGIDDLSIDIPKSGIFVLLGPNGAGKSTLLSILGGLATRTSGTITFAGGSNQAPRGSIGIVPQKNVLFPELTCAQTLQLWKCIKQSPKSDPAEDVERLLWDCDLGHKIHSNAGTLSGGQKRKLQLAIGLIAGSELLLVDECTSGVDPLSRRAIWKTLSSVRDKRTIIFTTHFLDEADLLADRIAILAAPGHLVADDTAVALKRELGKGYSLQVTFKPPKISEKEPTPTPNVLLAEMQAIMPAVYTSTVSPTITTYHLKTNEHTSIEQVLHVLESNKDRFNIASYDILGSTVEDVFIDLMTERGSDAQLENTSEAPAPIVASTTEDIELNLADGRKTSPLSHALTIFHKRLLITRRSWLVPLLTLATAIIASTASLKLLPKVTRAGVQQQTCTPQFSQTYARELYYPDYAGYAADGDYGSIYVSPPDVVSGIGNDSNSLPIVGLADQAAFKNEIQQNYANLSFGGLSIDTSTGSSLFAWEGSYWSFTGPSMLNLLSNIHLDRALNETKHQPTHIQASYEDLPSGSSNDQSLSLLKWLAFFSLGMAVYPAFFALYVSKERRSSVQAMQMSNGLGNPLGLWLGHLLFDIIVATTISTVVIIVFAVKASATFTGLGLFWLVLFFYGIAGTLFAYCLSLLVSSPAAAFALVAVYQSVMFGLYIAGYLLTLTYGAPSTASHNITVIHFTLALLSPVLSVIRAAFISTNSWSLLCYGSSSNGLQPLGSIYLFGGPIMYLILWSSILLVILVWVDSGVMFPGRPRRLDVPDGLIPLQTMPTDQEIEESLSLAPRSANLIQVRDVSKTFGEKTVVDDVTLEVSRDTLFALLGPNGAGKTTTFNMIRGDVKPDKGDVLVEGTSVLRHPQLARLSLGVCPQFTAIDSQLTVREHLLIYGRLKGLGTGRILRDNVETVMRATSIVEYADRLANKLSGGNQRKLSLAIALIGNPSVLLIDEFSTGVDAKMKREMWETLRKVAKKKAVIITTHSMEEASALANQVGILAKRLLAVGSTEELQARYPTYEVHFSCHNRREVERAQELMSQIPGSRQADDVATRFEVPVGQSGLTLPGLFAFLANSEGFPDYTVEKASLESIFIRVIRENNITDLEDITNGRRRRWFWV